jgi:hypothetical protein
VRLDGTGKPENGHDAREARELIRNYFEEFVNEKNVQVGNLNFAADFVELGADVPPGPAANATHSGLIHPGFQGLSKLAVGNF